MMEVTMKSISLIFLTAACSTAGQAIPIGLTSPPGSDFDLTSYSLQTLDGELQFHRVESLASYRDAFFYTDRDTGAMIFRVPSGAGHTGHSEFPRVELRERPSWIMGDSGRQHSQRIVLRVMSEPANGELIFAQIHGEPGGSEALKMRWSHGDIIMGFKDHFGGKEQRFVLQHGLALGTSFECSLLLKGRDLTVRVASGDRYSTRIVHYETGSWKGIPLYYKAGLYSQDKVADGSVAMVAVERLEIHR
jgi:hypothetical protein